MIDWFALGLSTFGITLNAHKNIWCWPMWLASSVVWILYAYQTQQHALVVLNVIFGAMNIYGWWKWSTSKPQ